MWYLNCSIRLCTVQHQELLTSPKGCAVTPGFYVGGYEDRVVSRASIVPSIVLAGSSVIKQHRCETGWGNHAVCAVYN